VILTFNSIDTRKSHQQTSHVRREKKINMREAGQMPSVGKASMDSPSKTVGEKRKESAGNPFVRKPKFART
jgi:hypothetical protein